MSTRPPQLQLSIPVAGSSTTSFKRTFEQLGLDLSETDSSSSPKRAREDEDESRAPQLPVIDVDIQMDVEADDPRTSRPPVLPPLSIPGSRILDWEDHDNASGTQPPRLPSPTVHDFPVDNLFTEGHPHIDLSLSLSGLDDVFTSPIESLPLPSTSRRTMVSPPQVQLPPLDMRPLLSESHVPPRLPSLHFGERMPPRHSPDRDRFVPRIPSPTFDDEPPPTYMHHQRSSSLFSPNMQMPRFSFESDHESASVAATSGSPVLSVSPMNHAHSHSQGRTSNRWLDDLWSPQTHHHPDSDEEHQLLSPASPHYPHRHPHHPHHHHHLHHTRPTHERPSHSRSSSISERSTLYSILSRQNQRLPRPRRDETGSESSFFDDSSLLPLMVMQAQTMEQGRQRPAPPIIPDTFWHEPSFGRTNISTSSASVNRQAPIHSLPSTATMPWETNQNRSSFVASRVEHSPTPSLYNDRGQGSPNLPPQQHHTQRPPSPAFISAVRRTQEYQQQQQQQSSYDPPLFPDSRTPSYLPAPERQRSNRGNERNESTIPLERAEIDMLAVLLDRGDRLMRERDRDRDRDMELAERDREIRTRDIRRFHHLSSEHTRRNTWRASPGSSTTSSSTGATSGSTPTAEERLPSIGSQGYSRHLPTRFQIPSVGTIRSARARTDPENGRFRASMVDPASASFSDEDVDSDDDELWSTAPPAPAPLPPRPQAQAQPNPTSARRRLFTSRRGRRPWNGGFFRQPGDPGDYIPDSSFDSSYESLLHLSSVVGDAKPRGTPNRILEKLEKSSYKEFVARIKKDKEDSLKGKGKAKAVDREEDKVLEGDDRCVVCLDEYADMDRIMKIQECGHWLHQGCLEQWLQQATTCPVCRYDLCAIRSPRVAVNTTDNIAPPMLPIESPSSSSSSVHTHEPPSNASTRWSAARNFASSRMALERLELLRDRNADRVISPGSGGGSSQSPSSSSSSSIHRADYLPPIRLRPEHRREAEERPNVYAHWSTYGTAAVDRQMAIDMQMARAARERMFGPAPTVPAPGPRPRPGPGPGSGNGGIGIAGIPDRRSLRDREREWLPPLAFE